MNAGTWSTVAEGIGMTLGLTAVGFALGAVLGLPLLVIRTARFGPSRWLGRGLIDVIRGVPLVVWLFLIYNGPTQFDATLGSTFTSWRSAVAALSIVSAAYMAEIYRGSLRAINTGQWEASRALGLSRVDAATRIIGPQMVRVAVPAAATYAIGLLKDSSLASTIGVFEITYYASTQAADAGGSSPFLVAGVYYIALTFPAAVAANRLDVSLKRKVAR
jgi:polar amino acid transport system permease protein